MLWGRELSERGRRIAVVAAFSVVVMSLAVGVVVINAQPRASDPPPDWRGAVIESSQGADPVPPGQAPPTARGPLVEYFLTGTIAGRRTRLVVQPDGRAVISEQGRSGGEFKLPEPVLGELRRLLERADFPGLRSFYRSGPLISDAAYQYVSHAGKSVSVGGGAPKRLLRVLGTLSTIVNRRPQLLEVRLPGTDSEQPLGLTVLNGPGNGRYQADLEDELGQNRSLRLPRVAVDRLVRALERGDFNGRLISPYTMSEERGYELTYDFQTAAAPTLRELGLTPEARTALDMLVGRAFAATRFRATKRSVRRLLRSDETEGLGRIARQPPPGSVRRDPSDRYVVPRLRDVQCGAGECYIAYNADTPDALQRGLSADPPPPEDEILDGQFYLWPRLFTDPRLERVTLVAYGRSGSPYVTVSCGRSAIKEIFGRRQLNPRRELKRRCSYEQAERF